MTAELKKGKYIYYHCTGKRGGECKKDYIREEEIEEVFLNLISRLPNPDEYFPTLIQAEKEFHKERCEYQDNSVKELQKKAERLASRLENLYQDKLDGIISKEEWKTKHDLWRQEKEEALQKVMDYHHAENNFYEGSNLLENFCKHAQEGFLKANAKEKQQILKMIGSNFTYKDGKLSVELNSVFNYLINLPSVKLIAEDEARTRNSLLGRQVLYH